MIPFNKPPFTEHESKHLNIALQSDKLCGNGPYSLKCHEWFEENLPCKRALLTPSCTHALEMAAILIDTKPGDEIIMPSYTFVSTANAFVLRGAKIVFVDVRPDTMNIDETKIEEAITKKTKAIVPVHYAGVGCEMDTIQKLAKEHTISVIEDAAQGFMGSYKGKALGTLSDVGTFSFHETKNYTSGGEGGLAIINNAAYADRAEIIREKGTNRSLFFRGMIDKYSWVDIGSSYLPGELQAACLYAQIQQAESIKKARLHTWNLYRCGLNDFVKSGRIEVQSIHDECDHPAHMFYIKLRDLKERTSLMEYLTNKGVQTAFHYIPLHNTVAGKDYARFHGDDVYTTKDSDRLLRLPLWYGLPDSDVRQIIDFINDFFSKT